MYDNLDLRQIFIATIAQGVAVPGLNAEVENADSKYEWVGALGDNLAEVYLKYPILKTYLEYHVNTKGEPMSLEGRPYLLDIIVDQARDVVVRKSVQCGITEIALTIAYTEAGMGQSILYALPGAPERNRFVGDRVDRQLYHSSYYKAMVADAGEAMGGKAADAKSMKHFGSGVLHFVGTNTPGEFSQFPADRLIVDERDLCNPDNLGLARDRLAESEYKRTLSIGNPRAPGADHTVGALYNKSDMKRWLVECEHCEHEQALDWYEHFVRKADSGAFALRNAKARSVCTRCGKPFNRLGPGRWAAQHPERRLSGYHISKLFTPSADPLEIFEQFINAQHNETALQIFHESELGEYYMPQASHLRLEYLISCIDKALPDWSLPQGRPIVMGVDVGAVLHVKASVVDNRGHRLARTIVSLAGFDELATLVQELNPAVIVIDAQPEMHKVAEFAATCPCPVWPCEFGRELTKPYETSWNKRTGQRRVRATRTAVMDGAYAAIRKREVRWPAQAQHVDGFFYQMQVPVRILDKSAASGAGRYVWTKGEDHYRLADTYEWLAARLLDEQGVSFEWVS